MILAILRFAAVAAFFISIILLTAQILRTSRFGKSRVFSKRAGDPQKGVVYAFGIGMMPWEKESAYRHLPTYLAGMIYHAGIFSALGWCFALAFHISLPGFASALFQALMASGFLVGFGLLLKRAIKLQVRSISFPDDYLSNILVDAFLLSGFLSVSYQVAVPVFFSISILTFLYMPMGKIRHCFFFFYSRILFGRYFGRRGILPHKSTGSSSNE